MKEFFGQSYFVDFLLLLVVLESVAAGTYQSVKLGFA